MYRELVSISVFVITMLGSSIGQQRSCGFVDHLQRLQNADPSFLQRYDHIHQSNLMKQHQRSGAGDSMFVIPTVVHIIYFDSTQNISDAQVQTQINVLNKDFRRLNLDTFNTPAAFQPFAADAKIEFCLAVRDPSGLPTSGITRTSTTTAQIGSTNKYYQTSQGGKDNWNPQEYMNIWVCEIDGSLLGFATPPGGSPGLDGIVIDYRNFGTTGTSTAPYNKGRTGTHEIGHWLGLQHVWGTVGGCGDDDGVNDTPLQSAPYGGCPVFPQNSCGTDDMYMNYMDYTNDNCMNLFTLGQKALMRGTLTASRSSISVSSGCEIVAVTAGFFSTDTVFEGGSVIQYFDSSTGGSVSWQWLFEGGFPQSSSQQNPLVYYDSLGTFDVTLIVYNGFTYDTLLINDYVEVVCPFMQIQQTVSQPNCHNQEGAISVEMDSIYAPHTFLWFPDSQNTNGISNLESGSYTLYVSDRFGCDSVLNFSLDSSQMFTTITDISDADADSCNGTLNLSITGGIPPFSFLTLGMDTNETGYFDSLCPGFIQYFILDSLGCVISDSANIGVLIGLKSPMSGNQINVFPIPSTERMTVQSKIELKEIKILDIAGQVLKVMRVNNEFIYEFTCSEIPPSTYFLQITDLTGTVYKIGFVKL